MLYLPDDDDHRVDARPQAPNGAPMVWRRTASSPQMHTDGPTHNAPLRRQHSQQVDRYDDGVHAGPNQRPMLPLREGTTAAADRWGRLGATMQFARAVQPNFDERPRPTYGGQGATTQFARAVEHPPNFNEHPAPQYGQHPPNLDAVGGNRDDGGHRMAAARWGHLGRTVNASNAFARRDSLLGSPMDRSPPPLPNRGVASAPLHGTFSPSSATGDSRDADRTFAQPQRTECTVGGYSYPSYIPPYPICPNDGPDVPLGSGSRGSQWNAGNNPDPAPVHAAPPPKTDEIMFPRRSCSENAKTLARILLVLFALAALCPINLEMCRVSATSANWFNVLAWLLVGFPALLVVYAYIGPKLVRAINPSRYFGMQHLFSAILLSAAIGLIFGFFYGLSEAKVKAAKDYLRPEQFVNVSCWNAPQVDIVHPGRMHFIYLAEEDWSIDCSGFKYVKHPEGAHYFSTAPLRYTGRAAFNCPHAYYPVCYSTHAPACDSMKYFCFQYYPPNAVLLQVVNQNEQFFQALPAEEEDQYRRMMPDLTSQFVVFGTDEGPEYYEDKYNYHSRAAYALWVTAVVLQAVVAFVAVAVTFHGDIETMQSRHFSLNSSPVKPRDRSITHHGPATRAEINFL